NLPGRDFCCREILPCTYLDGTPLHIWDFSARGTLSLNRSRRSDTRTCPGRTWGLSNYLEEVLPDVKVKNCPQSQLGKCGSRTIISEHFIHDVSTLKRAVDNGETNLMIPYTGYRPTANLPLNTLGFLKDSVHTPWTMQRRVSP
ncbi:hypothetical protein AVEN_170671-1, partial [Araneus ventricosus]